MSHSYIWEFKVVLKQWGERKCFTVVKLFKYPVLYLWNGYLDNFGDRVHISSFSRCEISMHPETAVPNVIIQSTFQLQSYYICSYQRSLNTWKKCNMYTWILNSCVISLYYTGFDPLKQLGFILKNKCEKPVRWLLSDLILTNKAFILDFWKTKW